MANLWEQGRFREAAALYDHQIGANPPLSATLLRARAYLKSDDAPAAIAIIERAKPGKGNGEARRILVLAQARAQVGNYEAADDSFDRALQIAHQLHDPTLAADIAYYRAQRFLFERRPDAAKELLPLARSSVTEFGQLRALHLESFVLNYEGRHLDQARLVMELLGRIDPNQTAHMEIRAWATCTLAYLAREIYVPEALPEVERQLGGTPWPPDFDDRRFQTLKALGSACALRGDYFNAFRFLRYCSRSATNDASRAIAAAERAALARCKGEMFWSRQELAEAEEYAANVNWNSVRDDSRIGLLLLAELFVAVDPAKAALYQARFNESEGVRAPNFYLKNDPRLAALVQYAEGVVDLAIGHRKVGVSLLKKALETFRERGYEWRTGRCALRLYEATREESYVRLAHEYLRHYMNSWLGDEYRASLSPQAISLPPMQRRVLDELRKGLTVPQIAKKFGRSEHTIRNHIKPIFKAYGVKSRDALIAKVETHS